MSDASAGTLHATWRDDASAEKHQQLAVKCSVRRIKGVAAPRVLRGGCPGRCAINTRTDAAAQQQGQVPPSAVLIPRIRVSERDLHAPMYYYF